MTTIKDQCEARGCTKIISFGIETQIRPRFCSFECRDRTEGIDIHAPPIGEAHQHGRRY